MSPVSIFRTFFCKSVNVCGQEACEVHGNACIFFLSVIGHFINLFFSREGIEKGSPKVAQPQCSALCKYFHVSKKSM